jgi:hypothetical protein
MPALLPASNAWDPRELIGQSFQSLILRLEICLYLAVRDGCKAARRKTGARSVR